MKLFLAVVVRAFAATSGDLEGLRFIEGSRKGESGGASIEEHWTEAAGGTMLGVSRTISSAIA